jgi:AcrR family transcriptional regulator
MTTELSGHDADGIHARRRGRPPRITLDSVVAVAAEIGLEHLTARAVADRLGVTRAALYHYVGSIEELRRIVANHLLPGFTGVSDDNVPWQVWLRQFAAVIYDWGHANFELTRHVPGSLLGSASVATMIDDGIAVLVRAGFDPARAAQALQFVAGVTWINLQDAVEGSQTPDGSNPRLAALRSLIEDADDNRQHLKQIVTEDAIGDPETRFTREIDWVVDALEVELARATAPRAGEKGE